MMDAAVPDRCATSAAANTVDHGARLAMRPKEAATALGIGERLLWSMTNRGEIPHLKLGKAVLYPVLELERWLSERTQRNGGER